MAISSFVNRDSHIPMYVQLADLLRNRIAGGDWNIGDCISSDREIGEAYGVSRATVLQALSTLAREGIVYRTQGKGTVVVKQRVEYDPSTFLGFSDEFRKRGANPVYRVLTAEMKPCPGPIAPHLAMTAGDEAIYLSRLLVTDELPMAVQTIYFPHRVFPGFLSHDLSQSVKRLIEGTYHQRFDHLTQLLRARLCTTDESQLLEMPRRSAVLEMTRIVYTASNLPFAHMKATLRGDQYDFVSYLKV